MSDRYISPVKNSSRFLVGIYSPYGGEDRVVRTVFHPVESTQILPPEKKRRLGNWSMMFTRDPYKRVFVKNPDLEFCYEIGDLDNHGVRDFLEAAVGTKNEVYSVLFFNGGFTRNQDTTKENGVARLELLALGNQRSYYLVDQRFESTELERNVTSIACTK